MKHSNFMLSHCTLSVILACNSAPQQAVSGPEVIVPTAFSDSVNVQEFGAIGDGHHDDTAAFRASIAALGPMGGMVYVPAGIYTLTPTSGVPDRAVDLTGLANITISGDGLDRTILRLRAGTYRGDTHIIYLLESKNITIRDIELDGNRHEASFSDEQNHCVEVWRGTKNLLVESVRFNRCRGDGIRLIGPVSSAAAWTEDVTIRDSRFENTGRSGIAVQRGVRRLHILDNSFDRISDQSIDMEPTGKAGSLAPRDVFVEGNVIRHTTKTWAVAIGGVSTADVMQRVTFRGNRVTNGSVLFGKADSLMIEGNTIMGDPLHPALRLARNVTNVSVSRNVISGAGGGAEGLLQIVAYNGAHPDRVAVRDNQITVAAGQTGIYIRDALGAVEVSGNHLNGGGENSGIHIASIARMGLRREGFSVVDNDVANFGIGIHFSAQADKFSNVSIRGNTVYFNLARGALGMRIGILFVKTGPYGRFANVTDNRFGSGIFSGILERHD